ncbi:MAG: metal-dependent transcriptional regulator [Chloroflexi bacterium]|nr:metal-dependent transcriptional regulator [Chloroflexota bacterium]
MAESESVEMYLKTILELTEGDEPVAISRIAERMSVSTVSANEMMKRLAERDMIVHLPYKGVQFTDYGRQDAISVVRRHRLWERFLYDHLGISWAQSHDMACKLEHATGEELTNRLSDFLGNPETCPHGHIIPTADGELVEPSALHLADVQVGYQGRVLWIGPEETDLLEYLDQRGIRPDVCLTLEAIEPFEGPLSLMVGEHEPTQVIIGRKVAEYVFVEPR